MQIRLAAMEDSPWLKARDHHIAEDELRSLTRHQRALLACVDACSVGWLRWNLFWDNTPVMNMLYVLEDSRSQGFGRALVTHWERLMQSQGYDAVLTSTMANENAQHFYWAMGYRDAGALLLPGEPTEIIFYKVLHP